MCLSSARMVSVSTEIFVILNFRHFSNAFWWLSCFTWLLRYFTSLMNTFLFCNFTAINHQKPFFKDFWDSLLSFSQPALQAGLPVPSNFYLKFGFYSLRPTSVKSNTSLAAVDNKKGHLQDIGILRIEVNPIGLGVVHWVAGCNFFISITLTITLVF